MKFSKNHKPHLLLLIILSLANISLYNQKDSLLELSRASNNLKSLNTPYTIEFETNMTDGILKYSYNRISKEKSSLDVTINGEVVRRELFEGSSLYVSSKQSKFLQGLLKDEFSLTDVPSIRLEPQNFNKIIGVSSLLPIADGSYPNNLDFYSFILNAKKDYKKVLFNRGDLIVLENERGNYRVVIKFSMDNDILKDFHVVILGRGVGSGDFSEIGYLKYRVLRNVGRNFYIAEYIGSDKVLDSKSYKSIEKYLK